MRVKYFLIGLVSALIISACATIYPFPEFKDRIYHFCSDSEVENPVGKICMSRCIDRKLFSDKCKKWETDVRIISDDPTFYQFRAAGFKCQVGI